MNLPEQETSARGYDNNRQAVSFIDHDHGYTLHMAEGSIAILSPDGHPITARYVDEYVFYGHVPADFRERYASCQIVEVGAGLAEFSPYMATIAEKRPIVIDPADYRTIRSLLQNAQEKPLEDGQRTMVQMLLDRIAILLDPTKIQLFSESILDIPRHETTLRGVGDIVLDVHGGIQCIPIEHLQKVYEIEEHFLSKQWWEKID